MYTQCPECELSFRVTAKVLQQAAGNVRCGNCAHAFNALHFLSEEKPAPPRKPDPASDKLAETSRRLLKTLDELAGTEDVRIEDTGVEWRVLDDEEDQNDKSDDGAEPVLTVAATDERRYDDNTPLPDDFAEDKALKPAPMPLRREVDYARASDEFEERQGDLALSEPEDWTDLLDEVRDPETEALEVEEELAAIHTQLSAREERQQRSPVPANQDARSGNQAEAIGLGIAGADDALTDEVPLLAEADFPDGDADEFVQDEVDPEDAGSLEDDDDEFAAASDDDRSARPPVDDEVDAEEQPEVFDPLELADDELADDEAADEGDFAGREPTGEFEEQISIAARALAGDDEHADDAAGDADEEPEQEYDSAEIEQHDADLEEPSPDEEDPSVDLEIDQELMAAANSDDDGTSTLVSIKDARQLFDEHADSVETIIMEGEFVRSAIEDQRLAAESTARNQFDDAADLADTYATSRDKLRGGRRKSDPPSLGMTFGIILLALLLAGQWIHNTRESLATFGLFNQAIAPLYQALGIPVTPKWNVAGWQFEATNGSVGVDDSALTIVSRLANRTDQPLPYPLMHVSLTDRWEDIMGSRILEPGEYLAGDLDPTRPVMPGENFTAVITIDNPSDDATGFKLNVCYRDQPGTVRCADENFRN